ncbi:MAG TPA: hypothetical protein VHB72_00450 [Candidatus Saccharimonadales bacterium]|jgi:hypothetical protein|nr:hypothetical protein [Candidatus Saccharimonadales bacterium]
MLVAAFFSWWYGQGWQGVAKNIGPRLAGIAEAFSAAQLLRTLFSPWRRIITYPGSSFAEKFRAWGDNIFSRAVGFVVRLLVLFAALLVIIVVAFLSVIELIAWPLLPLAVPVLIIMGVV